MSYYLRRIGAYVIDLSVISMFIQVMLLFVGQFLVLTRNNILIDLFMYFLYLFILVFVSVGYNMVCYRYFKYPLGKMLMRIQILDEKQQRVSMKRYFIRECNKYVYMYATLFLYVPYQFFTKVVKDKQTFHDKQADTHIFM